jgi:hypothetical protein
LVIELRRDLIRVFVLGVALPALLLGNTSAWASKKKALETYSAEDPDPMEASASAITLAPGEAPGIAAPQERPLPPSAGSVKIQAAPQGPAVSARWQTAKYDRVPTTQTDGISYRLRLVEEILRKHGRAYDYRSLTVKDLELILAELDAQAERGIVSGDGR